jgi:2,4-dienoyl-CoA reductase-like NADH-dependent reductase (Old Yellow Enzyme family)
MPSIESPLTLPCGITLRNRLAKAAMTEGLADPRGVPTPELERLYRLWSHGGAGVSITGNVEIDRLHLERPGNVIIEGAPDEELRTRLASWARAGTEAGNHLWMQISHAGRQTPAAVNRSPKAPSAVRLGIPGDRFGEPQPLTEPEIIEVIERFAIAAVAAREAGFSGVQIHGAHGYLISQFLSPRANQRTDAWGGSLENRARLLMEIVARVRQATGRDFAVTVKLNSADFQRGGFAFEESLQVAVWLEAAGIDLLEISGGTYEQPKMMGIAGLEPVTGALPASTVAREAYFLDFASAMRARIKMPLLVTGGFRSRLAMEQALQSGAADVIGLARPMCVETDAPRKVLEGKAELPRWERQLNLLPKALRWAKRVTLIRALDGFAVLYWFYAQLYFLGRSGAADAKCRVFTGWRLVERHHARWVKESRKVADNASRNSVADAGRSAGSTARQRAIS